MTRKTLAASVGVGDMRDDLLSIIGYTGEFSEPNSHPVIAFYTDRYLSPVLDALVEYVEMRERRARRDLLREIEGMFNQGGGTSEVAYLYNTAYQHGVDDTNKRHDRLCTPPFIARKETLKEVIHILNEMIVDGIVPASRIAESDAFLWELDNNKEV
jgi:hypothetical protein